MTEVVVASGLKLPASWTVAPVCEVAEISPKVDVAGLDEGTLVHFVPMASVAEEFGGLDASQLRPLKEVRKGYTAFSEGDVLFAKITPCMENGKGALVPQLPRRYAFGSTEFHVLRPKDAVAGKWLSYYLAQPDFRRVARQNMAGTAGQLRVPAKWLSTVGVPVPPRCEQTRIIEKLEELLSDLDAGVTELKAAQRKLAQYRQSLLKAAVEGALTADWRAAHGPPQETGADLLQRVLTERRARWEQKQLAKFVDQRKTAPHGWQTKYSEPIAPDLNHLSALPEGWKWASVAQVAAETLIGLDRGQEYQSTTGAVGYIKMNNVSMTGDVHTDGIVRIDADDEEVRRYSVVEKDLLFNTRNSKELVGKVGLIRSLNGPTVYNNNLMRIRFDGAVSPEFACYQLCGPEFRGRMEKVKKATTSVAAVYAKDLLPLAIAVPPMDEQAEVVHRLDAAISGIDQQKLAIELALKQAVAQRRNLLKAAFTGKLVHQDPSDEPASELLARIRAEHTGNDGRAARRRRKSV